MSQADLTDPLENPLTLPKTVRGDHLIGPQFVTHNAPPPSDPDHILKWLPDAPLRSPPIRQSLIHNYRGCPRYFLLADRCGIRKPERKPPALVGAFFHDFVATYYNTIDFEKAASAAAIRAESERGRWQEWVHDGGDPSVADGITDEIDDAYHKAYAMARYFTEEHLPIDWTPVGSEIEFSVTLGAEATGRYSIGTPVEGRIDRIVYDHGGKLLHERPGYWIVEYKTCDARFDLAGEALRHARSLQVQLYRIGATEHLRQPDGSTGPLLGVLLCLIKRPSIKLCGVDRACEVTVRALKSGPRKGQMTEDRKYSGPPLIANYCTRMRTWYEGTGEYAKLAAERGGPTSKPVLRVAVPFGGKPLLPDSLVNVLYLQHRASTAAPLLSTFYEHDASCVKYGRPCVMTPLCNSHPGFWIERMAQHGLRFEEPDYAASDAAPETSDAGDSETA